MYTVSTASAHFSRSSTAANPVPASPRRYSLHQRYPDTSFLSPPDTQLLPAFQNHQPPSRPGYHSYAPPAYEDYASPLLSEPTYHGPRYHAAATSNSAEERERKRRISHSAMERRRRERTNNVIDELKALVPWIRNEARMQKLEVLEQCVSYIKSLQQHLEPQSLLSASVPLPSPTRKRRRTSSSTFEKEVTPASDAPDSPHVFSLLPQSSCQTMPYSNAADSAIVSISHSSSDASSPHSQDPPTTFTCNESSSSCSLPELVVPSSSPTSSTTSSAVLTASPICDPRHNDIAELNDSEADSGKSLQQVKNSIGFLTS